MKAYGLPKISEAEFSDDVKVYRYGIGGSNWRPGSKERTRRVWKKIERARVKQHIFQEVQNEQL